MLPISTLDVPRYTPEGVEGVSFRFVVPNRIAKVRIREALIAANATTTEADLQGALIAALPEILVPEDVGSARAAIEQYRAASAAADNHRMVEEPIPPALQEEIATLAATVEEIETHARESIPTYRALCAKAQADRDITADIVLRHLLAGWDGLTHPVTKDPLHFVRGPDGFLRDDLLERIPSAWMPGLALFAFSLFGVSGEQKKSSASPALPSSTMTTLPPNPSASPTTTSA